MKYLLPVSLIILISLIALGSSFNLSLTGDDYLGLWRYETSTLSPHHSLIKYLITDYGPQDYGTYLIRSLFGYQAKYYYLISFVLRLLAAFSIFPVVYTLTRNKLSAYISVLLFAVTTTGLETTDWSFNMPSYIAIIFLNLFVLSTLKLKIKVTPVLIFVSSLLFVSSILFQPIRMIFMPVFAVTLALTIILTKRNKKTTKTWTLLGGLFCILFVCIFIFSDIGGSIGVSSSLKDRITGQWIQKVPKTYKGVGAIFESKNYKLLAYPISQVGQIVYPATFTPKRLQSTSNIQTPALLTVIVTILFCIIVWISSKAKILSSKSSVFIVVSSLVWMGLNYFIFADGKSLPFLTINYFSGLVGGLFLIITIYLYKKISDNQVFIVGLTIALLLMILPLFQYWWRDPGEIQINVSRYLIVPAVGLSIYIGILASIFKKGKYFVITLCILFVTLHFIATYRFINHLALVREYNATESIRKSIPKNSTIGTDTTTMYYFEGDNPEILHHSLMFGFPILLKYIHNYDQPWNIGYTTDWAEVVNAYLDGSGLKRFGTIPIKPVDINNIYSYKLEWGKIIDTTNKTRNRLLQETVNLK